MRSSYQGNSIMNSKEARQGALYFKSALNSGMLSMDVLPNSYDEFYGKNEEKDYVSYCSFLKSKNGKKVMIMLEDLDEQRIC